MSNLICEDYFTDFVINNEGLVITRKEINLNSFDFNKENPLVCLTGYKNILQQFFTEIISKIKGSSTVIIIESDIVELKNEEKNETSGLCTDCLICFESVRKFLVMSFYRSQHTVTAE